MRDRLNDEFDWKPVVMHTILSSATLSNRFSILLKNVKHVIFSNRKLFDLFETHMSKKHLLDTKNFPWENMGGKTPPHIENVASHNNPTRWCNSVEKRGYCIVFFTLSPFTHWVIIHISYHLRNQSLTWYTW